jgi:HAE1 family hydrophobic/amphiphilic exporter-1
VLGRLFREFAVTICVAILISGVVSVTLTPMLCSRFLKTRRLARASGDWGRPRQAFQRLLAVRSLLVARQYAAPSRGRRGAGHDRVLSSRCRGSSRPGHRQIGHDRGRARHRVLKLVDIRGRVAEIVRADPGVAGLVSTIGGTAANWADPTWVSSSST